MPTELPSLFRLVAIVLFVVAAVLLWPSHGLAVLAAGLAFLAASTYPHRAP